MKIKLDWTVGHTCHGSTCTQEGCSFLILKELSPLQHSAKGKSPLCRMWAEIPVLPHQVLLSVNPHSGVSTIHLIYSPGSFPLLKDGNIRRVHLKISSLPHQLKLRTALGRAAAMLAQSWQCRGWARIAAPQTKWWHIQFSLFLKRSVSKQANVSLNIFNIYNE